MFPNVTRLHHFCISGASGLPLKTADSISHSPSICVGGAVDSDAVVAGTASNGLTCLVFAKLGAVPRTNVSSARPLSGLVLNDLGRAFPRVARQIVQVSSSSR